MAYIQENGCFDCNERTVQPRIPYCTITQNPTKYVHCVIWAKMIFRYVIFNRFTLQSSIFDEDLEIEEVSTSGADERLQNPDLNKIADPVLMFEKV